MSETEAKPIVEEVSALVKAVQNNSQNLLVGRDNQACQNREHSAVKRLLKRLLGRIPSEREVDIALS